jgi:hypothetical protein
MTTDRHMAKAYAAQEEVIVALRSIGGLDLAERLEDCTTTRLPPQSASPTAHFKSNQAAHKPQFRGSILDADPPAHGVKIARRNTRLLRHSGSGWPHICRSAACAWCRRPMIRGWWYGMCQWSASATTSLAIIPLHLSAGLPNAVRRLRRGLRDVRDRMARRRRLWRDVSLAGIAGGDHMALVMITHEGIDRREVLDALRR